jgi:hypothetical protein
MSFSSYCKIRSLSTVLFSRLFISVIIITANSSLGLTIDELMNPVEEPNTTPSTNSSSTFEAQLNSKTAVTNPAAASTSLDDIYSGRKITRLNKSKEQLSTLSNTLSKRCACTSGQCYDVSSRDISQQAVVNAAKKANQQLNSQKKQACQKWDEGKSLAESNAAVVQQKLHFAQNVEQVLDKLDQSSNEVRKNLKEKDKEIREAIAQQKSQSGFDWGKAIAMSVGAVAGGVGNLNSDAQAQILGGIVADSFSGDNSMGNLQSTVSSLNAPQAGGAGGIGGGNNSSAGDTFVIDEQFAFTCPHGGNHSVPIKAKSMACGQAMRRYAKSAGCNLVDDIVPAQENYYKACASEMYK